MPVRPTTGVEAFVIAAHIRIRILLALAVAVICGGVLVVTEVQRLTDESSFEQYAAIRELRGAATQTALVFEAALRRRGDAAEAVEAAERAVVRAISSVQAQGDRAASERRLVQQQVGTATALAELANEAAAGAPRNGLEARRDVLLDRFTASSDELLADLTVQRSEAQRDGRRPVIFVLVVFFLLGVLHLCLVERPASRERRRRRAQNEFGDAMQVARSEAEAYGVLSTHVERIADALQVTVLNRNHSADRLEPVTPLEADSGTVQALEGAAPDSCLAIRLARTYHRTPAEEPLLRCDVCGKNAEETMCVPSLVGGEVVGAVLIEHRRPLQFHRRQLIEHSVAEAAPVVANLRNLAIAESRAATDGLTGLPNQRTVHETLKRAAAQAGRSASPLGIVLFDLDHFKAINDTCGHSKGDEVLAAVGVAAAGVLRTSDFVGRLGGEEFAAVFPSTDRAGALAAAEKLRAAVAAIAVPGVDRRVTASFGVAVMPDDAGEPDLLLRVADRALYAAKNAGRNRVETIAHTPVPAQSEPVA